MKLMVRLAPAIFLQLLQQAIADLPVHCLRHQVAGDWEFTLGPAAPRRSSCGHHNPDGQYAQPPLDFVASQGPTTSLRLSLADPATVRAEDGTEGTWTMIYDEGFEVAIGDQVYFAFSNFAFVSDGNKGKTNQSHCDATQVGWYHNTERTQWGCYVGRKAGGAAPEVRRASLAWMSAQDSRSQQGPDSSQVPSGYKPWVPGSAGYDQPMPVAWQQSVVDTLNLLQLGWRATTYEIFQGKTPRELNRFAGVRRHRTMVQQKRSSQKSRSFSSFLGIGSRVRRADAGEAFDWRNQNGQNWLEPVVTQGDCGSCYTISTIHMLTARNRIRHDDHTEPSFSVSFPLYCSEYNQGCDGGYGFLQSKWSEDVGLVPESCAPFSQGGGGCQLAPGCDLGEKRYRAVNHHYVGGYYGASSEEPIRQELMSNGPMVMSFEPKEDFMYYKNGLYRSGPNRIHQEWEQVDHAVLLAGFGTENGQQYWTMQNSWGNDWGEDGFFRMARGIDESGCESIVVAADVAEEHGNSVLDEFLAGL